MINFIILTKTKDENIFNMTNNLIQSIKNTIYPENTTFSNYRIIIIESQKNCKYKFDNCITLQFDQQNFNYNHAINQSINYCLSNFMQNDWFCFMNNDLICDKEWILKINNVYSSNSQILSFGFETPYIKKKNLEFQIGYNLFKHLMGCVIFCNKQVILKIGKWDQMFDYYYQDDDYLQQLQKYNILHAVIKDCRITHLGQKTFTNIQKCRQDSKKFINKYGINKFIEIQYNKR